MRIAQEAFTNAIRHSGGHTLCGNAVAGTHEVELDAQRRRAGVSTPASRGEGLRRIETHCAAILGVRFAMSSDGQGTLLWFTFVPGALVRAWCCNAAPCAGLPRWRCVRSRCIAAAQPAVEVLERNAMDAIDAAGKTFDESRYHVKLLDDLECARRLVRDQPVSRRTFAHSKSNRHVALLVGTHAHVRVSSMVIACSSPAASRIRPERLEPGGASSIFRRSTSAQAAIELTSMWRPPARFIGAPEVGDRADTHAKTSRQSHRYCDRADGPGYGDFADRRVRHRAWLHPEGRQS